MGEYTKDEALAFIESLRLTVAGRVGFRWLGEKLSSLAAYVESVTAENERLNAYVDRIGARDDYEVSLQVGVDVGEVASHDGRDGEEKEEDHGPLLSEELDEALDLGHLPDGLGLEDGDHDNQSPVDEQKDREQQERFHV